MARRRFLHWLTSARGLLKGVAFDYIRAEDLPEPANLAPGTYAVPVITVNRAGQITDVSGITATTTIYGLTYDAPTATSTPNTTRIDTFFTDVLIQTTETDVRTTVVTGGTLATNGDVIEAYYAGYSPATAAEFNFYVDGDLMYATGYHDIALGPWEFRASIIRVDATTARVNGVLSSGMDQKLHSPTIDIDVTVTLASPFDIEFKALCAVNDDVVATTGYLDYKPV